MIRCLFALLLLACPSWATISTAMIFEVRQGGSNNSAGCFKEGATGSDLSQSNSESYGFSNLVIDGAVNTKVTSASHNFVAADVGNCLRISSGTGFTTGVFEILSVASNAATLDRSAGTLGSTGGVFHVGGALATLAQLNTDMCSGCRAYVKADATYSVGSAITLNFSNSLPAQIIGYTTSRSDGGSFTLQASAGSFAVLTLQVNDLKLYNIVIDSNSQSSSRCLVLNARTLAQNVECHHTNDSNPAIAFTQSGSFCYNCYVHHVASSGPAFQWNGNNGMHCLYCVADTLTGSAHTAFNFQGNGSGSCIYCVVSNNAVAGSDGFLFVGSAYEYLEHCVVYNTARDAVRINNTDVSPVIENCIFSTVTNGINNNSGTTRRAGDLPNDYNFTFNASGSACLNCTAGAHSATLTVDPFLSASTKDFRLNNTRGGGYTVRMGGAPTSIKGLLGTFYPDAGIAEHQDPKFRFFF